MDIEITGHGMELTDAMRDHVRDKFQRLAKHTSSHLHVVVTLESKKPSMRAEAVVHLNKNHLFAEARDHDMYAAIDSLVSKMDRQMERLKGRKISQRHN